MLFATLISGEVIIETVFNWPGVGRLSVEAMIARDFPVVQGSDLDGGGAGLLMNLLVDIMYAYVDPQDTIPADVEARRMAMKGQGGENV